MFNLVEVDFDNFDIEEDFWKLNPLLRYYPVFKDWYPKKDSSKVMWCVVLLNDPHPANKLYHAPVDAQREVIAQYHKPYLKLDTDELVTAYERYCMSKPKRAFTDAVITLVKRTKFLKETPYSLDYPLQDEDGNMVLDGRGNPIIMKGTAKDLDMMNKNTLAISEQYERAEKIFTQDLQRSKRVHGGRDLTAREEGKLMVFDEEE